MTEDGALNIVVNGTPRSLLVPSDRRLLDVLRDDLGLTGAKAGCGVGVCGACTVLVDGLPTGSCLVIAAQVDGAEIVTVEGLAGFPALRRLQQEFVREGGFQCGFCTSGQLVSAASVMLADDEAEPSSSDVGEAMAENTCRCGAYYGMARAVHNAVDGARKASVE